jgi:hypothetical protein
MFQGNILLPSPGLKSKPSKKPATSFEMSFDFEQRYIPEDTNPHSHHCDSVKSNREQINCKTVP